MSAVAAPRSPSVPPPRSWLAKLMVLLRRPPLLGLIATLVGFGIFFFKVWKSMQEGYSDVPKQWAVDYAAALNSDVMPDLEWKYFSKFWMLAMKCLAPAFVLGLLRMRGKKILVPLTAAAAAVGLYWLGQQMWVRWPNAQQTNMGEIPAPEAFLTHVGLILGLLFSIPVMVWLYLRSSTLDRYIVKAFLLPLVLCVLGMVGMMIINDLLSNANEFTKAGLDAGQITIFYLKQTPQLLGQILDVAVLLAVLFTLTRMSRFNEIISMLGSGRSLMRVALPLIIIATWLGYVGLCMGYEWGPSAQNAREQMLTRVEAGTSRNREQQKSQTASYNVVYRNRDANRTWFVSKIPGSLNSKEKLGLTVVIEDDGNGNFFKATWAKRCSWVPEQREWRFYDGVVQDLTKGSVEDTVPFHKLTEKWTETPWTLASGKIIADYLTVPELISYVRTNADQPESRLARYRTVLFSRYALPVRTLMLTLVGIAFGVVASRRGLLAGVAWAVGFFVLAYIGQIILQKTAESGRLLPAVGAWGVNLSLLFVAVVMLWQRNYNRSLMGWWTALSNRKLLRQLKRG